MELPFESRADAGALLAERLVDLADADMLVLALPRGGVPVGMEIATRFDADLDVLVVQKLGAPDQPELAVGAVGASGRPVVNEGIARAIGVHPQALQARADAVQAHLAGWADTLRGGRPAQPLAGRVVVVVDDGIATGATMRAALGIVRSAGPEQVVAAVPVAPPEGCAAMAVVADRVECLYQPEPFGSVGHWYRDFHQLEDEDVRRMLDGASRSHAQRRARTGR